MKKSLLLLTTILSFNIFGVSAASANNGNEPLVIVEPFGGERSEAAPAEDLARIKQHILGYTKQLGLSDRVVSVGQNCCCLMFSTTFKNAERFLLNEFAGQLIIRFLAIALDDLADGKLDGIAQGKKVSYAQEVGMLLGVEVSPTDLNATVPLDECWMIRLIELSVDIANIIIQSDGQKDKLLQAAGAFAMDKMNKARRSLAVALIQETDRIIALELGNGKIDGLDAEGHAIDWKKEMKDSVERSLRRVLDGVM